MDIHSVLARSRLFRDIHAEPLAAIAGATRVLELRGGSKLMEEGEPADSLYVVVSGRLRSSSTSGLMHREFGADESIGDVSVVANQPRMYTVHAVRDSVLLELPGLKLLNALQMYPGALYIMMRRVVRRQQQLHRRHHGPESSPLKTMSLMELWPGSGAKEFERRLLDSLRREQEVCVIDAATVDAALGPGTSETPFADSAENRRLVRWLGEQERAHDMLLFVVKPHTAHPEWQRRCLRQADALLLAGEAHQPRVRDDVLALLADAPKLSTREVILRRNGNTLGDVLGIKQTLHARDHHYWCSGDQDTVDGIARQLSGRAIGVVLGGGGARGFAHIGLARALSELNIPVDLFGGSSMGAFIAALWAQGIPPREMVGICRDNFVQRNLLNDFVLPRVSLIRGQRFYKALRDLFGDTRIEDLWHPYYCLSTNLTQGHAHAHRDGSLATWCAASMCIPGVAPPIGWRGNLHADGGIVNNLPTDVMHDWGRGPVLASNVGTEGTVHCRGVEGPAVDVLHQWGLDQKRPSLFEILTRTATLTSESSLAQRREMADVFLQMPVPKVGMFAWEHIDDLVRVGYDHAMNVLLESRALLQSPQARGLAKT